MTGRKTDSVTRVDIRIPNELYEQISDLAVSHFHAKIHHRSQKPEVTPTILELIKIGIAHLESTLPVTEDVTAEKVTDKLQQQIEQLNSRLKTVEDKLSGVDVTAPIGKSKLTSPRTESEQSTEFYSTTTTEDEKVLSDMELSDVLGVSNTSDSRLPSQGKKTKRTSIS